MEKLHRSMTVYVKSLSKRNEADDKEKILPVGYLGQTMIHHGEDFEPDSEFGNCLISAYIWPPWRSKMLTSIQAWAERTTESQESKKATLQTRLQDGSSHWSDHWP